MCLRTVFVCVGVDIRPFMVLCMLGIDIQESQNVTRNVKTDEYLFFVATISES